MKVRLTQLTGAGWGGWDEAGRFWIVVDGEPLEELSTEQLVVITRRNNIIVARKAP